MKGYFIYCDICKKEIGDDGDIRIKYRAKRKWCQWHEEGWDKIDICSDCLNKIISAKKEESL